MNFRSLLTLHKLSFRTVRSPNAGYSVGDAARRLGISREAVYKAIREGRLKARLRVITRRVWRIDAETLRNYGVSLSHQQRGKKRPRPSRSSEK